MQLHTGSLINITSDLREWESRLVGAPPKLLSVSRKQFPRSLNFTLVLLCDLSSFGLFALSPHAPAPRWGDGDSSVHPPTEANLLKKPLDFTASAWERFSVAESYPVLAGQAHKVV